MSPQTQFWIKNLITTTYPHFESDRGADLNGNNVRDSFELFTDSNSNGTTGDNEDYTHYFKNNIRFISTKSPFARSFLNAHFDINEISDIKSIEGDYFQDLYELFSQKKISVDFVKTYLEKMGSSSSHQAIYLWAEHIFEKAENMQEDRDLAHLSHKDKAAHVNVLKHHYRLAYVMAKKAYVLNPNSVNSLNQVAMLLNKLDHCQEALSYVERANTLKPNDEVTQINLKNTKEGIRTNKVLFDVQIDKSKNELKAAKKSYDNKAYTTALKELSKSFNHLQIAHDDLEPILKTHLQNHPLYLEILTLAGKTFFQLKAYKKAELNFVRALEKTPRDSDLLKWVSYTFYFQNQIQKARGAMRMATKIDPNLLKMYPKYIATLENWKPPAVNPALRNPDFNAANDWVCWLDNPNLEIIGNSKYDVAVIDYSADGSGENAFSANQIANLKKSSGGKKVVLSYLSIGEAEDYRFYFKKEWLKNGQIGARTPSFIYGENPDWKGNYKVRYWDPNWQKIIFGVTSGPNKSYLDRIIDAGFDGVYLDIIDAYEYFETWNVNKSNARTDMIKFVVALANHARNVRGKKNFLILSQNGEDLINHPLAKQYLSAIDGLGKEDTYFHGPHDNNNPYNEENINEVLPNVRKFKKAGKKVLMIDYVGRRLDITRFYHNCKEEGFVPYASHRGLNQITLNNDFMPD